jgi:hypothetical protein
MSTVETIYLIHHSHTDFGYTHDLPVFFEMQDRFLDEALDCCELHAHAPADARFRWTVETTDVLRRWLAGAAPEDISRLKAAAGAGLLEVCAMFANITPLYDTAQLIESLRNVAWLRRELGVEIRHAMNCDVNGQNWGLVDLLLDAGIEGFTMAINPHFGGATDPRPAIFLWEGPSGRRIPAFSGWPYNKAGEIGIPRDAAHLREFWPKLQSYLDEIGWPLPIIMIQHTHPFTDNGTADPMLSAFVEAWNAEIGRGEVSSPVGKGEETSPLPRLVVATPAMWWDAVKAYHDRLPVWRGDWTDFWNFGSISSAREVAVNRMSRARLFVADALYATSAAGEIHRGEVSSPAAQGGETPPLRGDAWLERTFRRYRDDAWRNLNLWDEHTWGADISIRAPEAEDTLAQWHHKANFAYAARSQSLMLQRDALAALARRVARESDEDLLVFNPLPWPRTITGLVLPGVMEPRGTPEDSTAGRHFQDRYDRTRLYAAHDEHEGAYLGPVDAPGFGYAVVPRSRVAKLEKTPAFVEDAVVENARFRLIFDRERGGISSLVEKATYCEWADPSTGYSLGGCVHEEVADREHPWPRHLLCHLEWQGQIEIPRAWKPGWRARLEGAERVLAHRVYRLPGGTIVEQRIAAPAVREYVQRVFLPDFADWVELETEWLMGQETHPEATYLAFPFALPGATARFDAGGQAVIPEADQLPGVCRDYFTAQGWVDFNDGERGVTVAVPENPMIQLGGFHFGDNEYHFDLERALLLGWVTNNYWETNFRAQQPGMVYARYRILPYEGAFDEARAHRFGLEAAHARPLVNHLQEPRLEGGSLPESGTLLRLPEPPVLVVNMRRAAEGGGTLLYLLNASDAPQQATIGSGLLKIGAARRCNLFGEKIEEMTVRGGEVAPELSPRRVTAVLLHG